MTYKMVFVHDCPITLLVAAAMLSTSDVNHKTVTALGNLPGVVPPNIYEYWSIVAVALANNPAIVETLLKSDIDDVWKTCILSTPFQSSE